jgi:hypothetical protein
MTLTTLEDVRVLMRHLPDANVQQPDWQHVAVELDRAAARPDTADVSIALCLALSIDGGEYRQS